MYIITFNSYKVSTIYSTYFTNKGLEIAGRFELAKNNVDDMLYLVERYGYMPNGSRTHYLGKSQPPFLCEMVKDVFVNFKDKVWLEGAYKTLEKEYAFWMTERITQSVLTNTQSRKRM